MTHLTGTFDFHVRGDKSLYVATISILARNKRSHTCKSILVQAGTAEEAIDFVTSLYPRSHVRSLVSVDELYNV